MKTMAPHWVIRLLPIGAIIVSWVLYTSLPILWLPAFASITLAFFLQLVVPGWLMLRLLRRPATSFAENILLAFALSTALLYLFALTALLGSHNLQWVMWWSWVITTLLYLAVFVQQVNVQRHTWRVAPLGAGGDAPHGTAKHQTRALRGMNHLAVAIVVLLTAVIAWTKVLVFDGSFDRHFYQGYMLHFMDSAHFFDQGIRFAPEYNLLTPREMLLPWLVVLSSVVKAAHTDLLTSYVTYLPALLIPLSFLAVGVLGRKITHSWVGGVTACLVQALYYVSNIGNNDTIGFNFFLNLIEDKFIIRFLIQIIAYWLMLEYYRSGARRWLIPLSAICLVMATTHYFGAVQFGIVAASFGALSLLAKPNNRQLRTLVVLACITVTMGLVPLWGRFSAQPAAADSTVWANELDFRQGLSTDELGELRSRRLWIFSEEPPQYIVSPHALEHPLMLVALLLIPFTLRHFRRSGARLLLATTIAPLVISFTPYLTPFVGEVITPWMLWRVLWIIQPALIIAFWVDRLAKWLRCHPPLHQTWRWVPLALPLLGAVLLRGQIAASFNWLEERGTRVVTPDTIQMLRFLRDHIEHGSLIIAESAIINDELPGMVGHSFGATYRWEQPPHGAKEVVEQRRSEFINGRLLTMRDIDFLQQYEASYTAVFVVIHEDQELVTQLSALRKTFALVYSNATYLVFKWNGRSATSERRLMEANSLALQGDIQQAQKLYKSVLKERPDDLLAIIGLAYIYETTDNAQKALSAYQQAGAQRPDDPWLLIRIADSSMKTAARQKDVDEALLLYIRALTLKPQSDQIARHVKESFIRLSPAQLQSPGAVALRTRIEDFYRQNYEEQPASIIMRRALAITYMQLGMPEQLAKRYERAEAYYRQAIELLRDLPADSNTRLAYVRLFTLLIAQSRDADALTLFRQANAAYPTLSWPSVEMGLTYLSTFDGR